MQDGTDMEPGSERQRLNMVLESSRTAEGALERQVQDLRKALKATGTPTEARSATSGI